jgi:hypothetical protein
MKHIKNFTNYRINESIPKSPRGNIFGSFDSIEWFDEIDRPATLDEIGDDYDEELFYDYDSYSKSKFFKLPWFGNEKFFNIYQVRSGGNPFIVRTRK